MTGNAGALEVLVDGETAPAIGAMGAVKRNVMLEPDRLKAGTAAN
jgi:cytoskeleton protein RodZ